MSRKKKNGNAEGPPPNNTPKGYITNKMYAANDDNFRACCAEVGVEPTPRQASKFRARKGSAWKAHTAGDVIPTMPPIGRLHTNKKGGA